MTESDHRAAVRTEAARLEEDSEYSSKGHYNAAAMWSRVHLWLGIPSVLFAATGAVSVAASSGLAKVVGAFASGLAGALTAVMTFLNAAERGLEHRRAGSEYHDLRARLRQLREVTATQANITDEKLGQVLDDLQERKAKLTTESPQIPRWAYERAQAGILAGEAAHRADAPGRKPGRRDRRGPGAAETRGR